MSFTYNNDSPDVLSPPMVYETISKMERDGLLVYSEKDIRRRVGQSIFVTVVICMLLAMVGMSAALFHARFRKPDEDLQSFAQETFANMGQTHARDDSGNYNNQNRELLPSQCFDFFLATSTNKAFLTAIEQCVETLYFVGCNAGLVSMTRYFQLFPGGIWFVECLCDC
jgi:hypothetical protein